MSVINGYFEYAALYAQLYWDAITNLFILPSYGRLFKIYVYFSANTEVNQFSHLSLRLIPTQHHTQVKYTWEIITVMHLYYGDFHASGNIASMGISICLQRL